MRIAIFRNISHQIPPTNGYGGTDRGVFELCRELGKRGHECHVFCAISPKLSELPNVFVSSCLEAAGRPNTESERQKYDALTREHFDYALKHFHALDSLSPFHIVNVRVDSSYLLDQLVASIGYSRIIYSLHNVRSKSVAKYYLDERLTCTTHTLSQKRSHGDGLNLHVVPYGVDIIEGQRACSPARRFPFRYILSIGAIGPHKGVRSAIRIAGGVALPIVVAGVPFDPRGRDVGSYLSTVIDECRLTGGEFVGEVNEAEKVRLIRDAEVVLFCSGMEDLSWEEPFGRVIAEAGLIGTPVAAFDCKSTRDLITAGLTGEFFDSIENAPAAVNNCVRLSRPDIRLQSSMRFSTGRFAEEFLSVCMKVIGSNSGSHGD